MNFSIIIRVVILIFIASNIMNSSSSFHEQEKLYVWADNGLNFRESPSIKSKILKVLPKGTQIEKISWQSKNEMRINIFRSNFPNDTIIEKVKHQCKPYKQKGGWIKVKHEESIGYVFDGFVSRYKISTQKDFINVSGYIRKYFKKISSKTISFNPYDKEIRKTYFETGITEINTLANYGDLKIVFPEMTLEEAVLLMRDEIENRFKYATTCKSEYKESYDFQTKLLFFSNGNWSLKIEETSGSVIIRQLVWC